MVCVNSKVYMQVWRSVLGGWGLATNIAILDQIQFCRHAGNGSGAQVSPVDETDAIHEATGQNEAEIDATDDATLLLWRELVVQRTNAVLFRGDGSVILPRNVEGRGMTFFFGGHGRFCGVGFNEKGLDRIATIEVGFSGHARDGYRAHGG